MSQQVVAHLMNSLQAEVLLEGSYILSQIDKLRVSFCQASADGKLSNDDYFDYLEREIQSIPRLELLSRVAPNVESTYIQELVESLDQIQEKITIVHNLALRFQARLIESQTAILEAGGAFEAWYSLAVQEFLRGSNNKMSQSTVKALAQSEFSRLMAGVPAAITSLLVAVKAETEHLNSKKRMAREKVELGREQVQAAWTTRLPPIHGVSGQPGSLGLIRGQEEEEDEEPPAYISNRTRMDEPATEAATEPDIDQDIKKQEIVEVVPAIEVDAKGNQDIAADIEPATTMLIDRSATATGSSDVAAARTFLKHGDAAPVEEISPAQAIETFNDQQDDGIEKPIEKPTLPERVIDAEPAEIKPPIPRIPDELDSLLEPKPEAAPKTPPKRKMLPFSYTDDIA